MRIRSTADDDVNKLKILIYGESGAGKTYLAGTLPSKTLIISSESGTLSLKNKNIDVIDITIDDNDNAIPKEKRIARLIEVYKFLHQDDTKTKYDWIFIDSLTEISQNMIEQLYAEFPDRKDSLVMYSENSKRMRSLIKAFRDIPHYNTVFTALPSIEKDENNRRYTSISLTGKLSNTIAGFFDEVLYLDVFEDEHGILTRKLITQKTHNLICKDRSGVLERTEDADLTKIINKIRGEGQC